MLEFLKSNYSFGYEFNEEKLQEWLEKEKIENLLFKKEYLREIEDGGTLCEQDEEANKVYLLLSGRVSVFYYMKNKKRIELTNIYAPALIGEMEALSEEALYCSTVKALGKVVCLEIPLADYLAVVESSVALAKSAAKRMAQLLVKTSEKNSKDLTYSNEGLLLFYFLKILEENADISEIILHDHTRIMLSEKTGIALRTLNRLISEFIDKKWIKIVRGKVCLTQEQKENIKNRISEL